MDQNNNNVWLGIAGFIILAIGFQSGALAAALPAGADLSPKARLVDTYGKLPLSFEENQGQTGDQVKFVSRGPGYTLFLTPTEAVLSLRKRAAPQAQRSEKSVIPSKATGRDPEAIRDIQTKSDWMPASAGMTRAAPGDDGEPAQTATLRIQLVGANPKPHVSGVDALPGKVNYFRGNKPNQWRTEIPTYGKVKYEDVYPGIDLVYYGNQRQLEHDFVVAPGVDPRTIRLAFAGAERVGIDGQGDLVLKTAGGDVRLQKPVVYQNVNGNRHKIAGRYVLHSGKRKDKRQVGFQVAAYDKGKPLIIDPVLAYSTYLGGSGHEFGDGIAVDNQGNAYVTGTTFFSDFPVTAGAFQTSFNGGSADVFIAKFNAAGSALLFSTYLGGSRDDQSQSTGATPRSIAVDTDGNAYVTGQTTSPDFPVTTGAFQTTLNAAAGAFVTKLTADGSALVYSTYLSGSGNASGSSIIIDNQGNAYVTGYAFPDFPATSVFGVSGNSDAFVAKLNSSGSALVYSALISSSSHDYGIGIALDSVGDVYVTGQTSWADFPIVNALYTTFNGQTAFVTKLNPSGSEILYSTYVPTAVGKQVTAILGVVVDGTDSVYLTGRTSSPDFPTTPGAFNISYNGGVGDALVMKLNSSGSQVLYSTFLGGSGDDHALSIALDNQDQGNAYVTGYSDSTNFPVTGGTIGATLGGGIDAFVTKLNASASALVYPNVAKTLVVGRSQAAFKAAR